MVKRLRRESRVRGPGNLAPVPIRCVAGLEFASVVHCKSLMESARAILQGIIWSMCRAFERVTILWVLLKENPGLERSLEPLFLVTLDGLPDDRCVTLVPGLFVRRLDSARLICISLRLAVDRSVERRDNVEIDADRPADRAGVGGGDGEGVGVIRSLGS